MTEREFFNAVSNGQEDVPQILLDILADAGAAYCLIGGLAVNAYTEPVVSLDLDIVIAARGVERLCDLATHRGLKIERFEHSINLTSPKSDILRLIEADPNLEKLLPTEVRERLG